MIKKPPHTHTHTPLSATNSDNSDKNGTTKDKATPLLDALVYYTRQRRNGGRGIDAHLGVAAFQPAEEPLDEVRKVTLLYIAGNNTGKER
jgi:hypothetical protein